MKNQINNEIRVLQISINGIQTINKNAALDDNNNNKCKEKKYFDDGRNTRFDGAEKSSKRHK